MVEIRAKRVLAALAAVLAVSGAQQEHAAAAYAADDARRQRHQRQRRVLILAAGSIQKRRKIRRNDGGWASSTINSYLLHGDARTYKLNFRMTRDTGDGAGARGIAPATATRPRWRLCARN